MDLAPLTLKQSVSLGDREDRAVARAVGAKILGNLTHAIKVDAGRTQVTVTWKTQMKWSEVHNVGGSAGHGAKIPQREVLTIEERDLDVFGRILKQHLLLAFVE
jgi:phage gpG-like protein